jgi:hypothetical protein
VALFYVGLLLLLPDRDALLPLRPSTKRALLSHYIRSHVRYPVPFSPVEAGLTDNLMPRRNGPLLMAVIAWSNSLVFHDIDKITSLWIHIYPPLGTLAVPLSPIRACNLRTDSPTLPTLHQ